MDNTELPITLNSNTDNNFEFVTHRAYHVVLMLAGGDHRPQNYQKLKVTP
jgi:hypothetical protein